ncbi:ATP-binding cassette domain-containing protein [Falsiroseomonas sp. HW251]|uniref:ATP-binding cassette domain-containing protein n=1 Tax=Falsiroseomonas sp. HW251 TaxID=3390998 RepID=UPI003D3170B1
MPLELRDTEVTFGGGLFGRSHTAALAGVSLALATDRAETLAIVGESGSGKTTLTRLLLGLLRPTAGRVLWQGQDVHSLRGAAFAAYRRAVQAVFQDPFGAYNPVYRVDRMLLLPARRFGLTSSDDEARALAARALEAVGLRPAETLGRYPHQLSGGQRQRLMVARAMMLKPRVIVADEPVSMVDASLRGTILGALHRLRQEGGVSLVYVTHDLTTAWQLADRVMVMRGGRVVEEGDVEHVIGSPRHPYTRALLDAVPPSMPDPGWLEREDAA